MSCFAMSSSSRRTWIEIGRSERKTGDEVVVLLAEDVDRNVLSGQNQVLIVGSSSSRRTWIEIKRLSKSNTNTTVVLLAEDVDRNLYGILFYPDRLRRPPRGGRG